MERTYTMDELQLALANLDNGIPESCEKSMKRTKLPIPQEYGGGWATGATAEDAVRNLIDRIKDQFKASKDSPLFNEYAESWYLIKMAEKRAAATNACYRGLLSGRIEPFFKGKTVADISPDDIQMFFNSIMHLSKSVSNQCKAILSGIFERACRNGIIERNPMQFKYEHSHKTGEKVVLQDEDLIAVINQLNKLDGRAYLYMCFLCFTALRRGEILGLKWGDIRDGKIFIQTAVSYPNGANEAVTSQPKDGSCGVVHLQSELAKRIEPFRGKPHHNVIPKSDRQPWLPITKTQFTHIWRKIGKTIDLKGATSHSFRATYATMMNAHCDRIDPKALQGALRHKTPDLAMKVYTKQNVNKTELAEVEYDEWLASQLSQTS